MMHPLLHVHVEAAEEYRVDLGINVEDSDASVDIHTRAAATSLVNEGGGSWPSHF